jgi:hypothetical protein
MHARYSQNSSADTSSSPLWCTEASECTRMAAGSSSSSGGGRGRQQCYWQW